MAKKTPGTALTSWKDEARRSVGKAKAVAAALPQGGSSFISLRGGVIKLGQQKLPNPLPMIVLAHQTERTYYDADFDPSKPATPACYSYDGAGPHDLASDKQNDACRTCPMNEFGSARQGAGKACKEGVKLAFISGDYLKSPDKIADAPIVQCRLSVLNAKTWAAFCQAFLDDERALWMSGILMHNEADEKSQYAVSFELGADLPDRVLDQVARRVVEAEKLLMTPYPKTETEKKDTKKSGAGRRKW